MITYHMDYELYAQYFMMQGYTRPTPTVGDIKIDMGVRSN